MSSLIELLQNETAMISMVVTAFTGLLTGPLFKMDPAAVGSITAMVVVIFNLWVRASVYSKKRAAQAVVNAATQAVAAITPETAGGPGAITMAGVTAVTNAAREELGTDAIPEPDNKLLEVA